MAHDLNGRRLSVVVVVVDAAAAAASWDAACAAKRATDSDLSIACEGLDDGRMGATTAEQSGGRGMAGLESKVGGWSVACGRSEQSLGAVSVANCPTLLHSAPWVLHKPMRGQMR